jgi:hypothetical protein
MRREGHIYERVCSVENIKQAIMKSSLGKRDQRYVRRILEHSDRYAAVVSEMLRRRAYVPSQYREKVIWDGSSGKERTICQPRYYPDQVIHWALMLQLQDIIMHGMYAYTCGSVPGRGTSYGQKALRRWLDTDYRGTKYCLKADISKFYPSTDVEMLKASFRRIIKDPDCLWLIDTILDSHPDGLPIGNYTSQWFSNYYLQGLDHYIKEQLGVRYYVRYVDDLVILGPNKRKLHRAREAICEYLEGLHLRMKSNWQVFRVDKRDIDFLGLRFFRNKTILRKRNSLRIRRRMRKIERKGRLGYRDACAVISFWGWLKRSNSYRFYRDVVRRVASVRKAKAVVKQHALRANCRRRYAAQRRAA